MINIGFSSYIFLKSGKLERNHTYPVSGQSHVKSGILHVKSGNAHAENRFRKKPDCANPIPRSLDSKWYFKIMKQDAEEHCLEPVHLLSDSLGLSMLRLQLEDLEWVDNKSGFVCRNQCFGFGCNQVSGSGSRRAKMTHNALKCLMFSFECRRFLL